MQPNPVSWNSLTQTSTATISNSMEITPIKGVRRYAYKAANATASISNITATLVITIVFQSHSIKRLNEVNQGEAEFLAEVSIIGRVNHMNLIAIWGYCVEGNHRLLVYEYMECGSLGENLISGTLDWEKRFDIAMNGNGENEMWLEEIIDPVMKGKCDLRKMEILVQVALECVKEDKDARPTMSLLVRLPRNPNIDDILKKYLDHRLKKDGAIADSIEEILNGLRCYFDKALPAMLLYKSERQQYQDATADHVPPSTVYGAEHLLRLFGMLLFDVQKATLS
ncbi:hypothetical protein RHSIM_Rhsim06G0056500 [Rhododendron simsii]|uniref:Protein kinase domain-containing protein n=1 Tax=Rhododendron simsii TaxID=118357 RepID=A0A834GVT1_RHOSS|nr:hypothetical protein RHSIM_Rhsim06G0056500 [Rhododendron simsii]